MKRVFLLLALLGAFATSFAQKIHFSDITNVWHMEDSTVGCCIPRPVAYTTAWYDSATVNYNGRTYLHFNSTMASVLIREDSNKVYVISADDSLERVLYDYTLGVNDTLRIFYPEDKYVSWVTEIDSTQLAGLWYKVWHFSGADTNLFYADSVQSFNYNVMEGIGCTNGGYYPGSPYSRMAFFQWLLCFSNSLGITTGLSVPVPEYGSTSVSYYDNNISCAEFHPTSDTLIFDTLTNEGVKQVGKTAGNAVVMPNPVAGMGKIALPYKITSGNVAIINEMGQGMLSRTFTDQGEIDFDGSLYAKGIYFFEVTDLATGARFTGKFAAY